MVAKKREQARESKTLQGDTKDSRNEIVDRLITQAVNFRQSVEDSFATRKNFQVETLKIQSRALKATIEAAARYWPRS